jgi:WD40 repeat protein
MKTFLCVAQNRLPLECRRYPESVNLKKPGFLKNSGALLLGLLLANTSVRADITEPIRTFQGHTDSVKSVAFSPDGNTVISGSSDSTIKLWNVQTGEEIRTFKGHSDKVYSVTFSPDGNTALSGSRDNTLKLWDIQTGKIIRTFRGHTKSVRVVAMSPDGSTALSGSEDNTIMLWEILTGKELTIFQGHTQPVYAVAFSSDGRMALSGSRNGTIKLWDIQTGQEFLTFEGHTDLIYSVAFSPDGHTAVSGSQDKTIKLWDIQTGQEIITSQGHAESVNSVTISENGRYALSGSQDNTIKLWDIKNRRNLGTFQGHTDWVYSVAFSPDGSTAISGSRDKTLKLWKVDLPATATFSVSPSTGTPPVTIRLDASQSLGQMLNYQWSTSHGKTMTGKQVDLTFDKSGTYTITLTVTDTLNQTDALEKQIVVNQPPEAAFALSPEQGKAPLSLDLDGSASVDSDGTIISYQWSSSDGQTATGKTAQMIVQNEGEYTITLTVTDNSNATATAKKTVSFGKKILPVATFTVSPTEGKKPLTVHLDASQSFDQDGNIVSWEWKSSSGRTLSGEKTNFILTAVGEQTITLTVTDNDGAIATAEKTVTVTGDAPVAKFKVFPLTGFAPLTVQLDGSDSVDSDGRITDYRWTISDGQQALGRTESIIFGEPGTYQITLVVTDNDGLQSDKATQMITVEKEMPPVAKLQAEPLSGIAPLTVALDGGQSFDPDGGTLVAYRWQATDGKNTLTASGETATLAFEKAGNYRLSLTVTDDEDNTSSNNVTLTITDTPQIAFEGLEDFYEVGDIIVVDLVEIVPRNSRERVDLWFAIQIPSGELFFRTLLPQMPFALKPQAFKKSLPSSETTTRLLEFEVIPGMGGEYILHGLYVKEGENPMEHFSDIQPIQRSNLVTQSTMISDQFSVISDQ